jgi:hypothetical protein
MSEVGVEEGEMEAPLVLPPTTADEPVMAAWEHSA